MIGVCWIFIKDFAKQAHHLNKLTRAGVELEFGEEFVSVGDDFEWQTIFAVPMFKE
jgi:hypothetical protein